jgi:hypothetical protein
MINLVPSLVTKAIFGVTVVDLMLVIKTTISSVPDLLQDNPMLINAPTMSTILQLLILLPSKDSPTLARPFISTSPSKKNLVMNPRTRPSRVSNVHLYHLLLILTIYPSIPSRSIWTPLNKNLPTLLSDPT